MTKKSKNEIIIATNKGITEKSLYIIPHRKYIMRKIINGINPKYDNFALELLIFLSPLIHNQTFSVISQHRFCKMYKYMTVFA